jgi:CheY-like chemotaxis protein
VKILVADDDRVWSRVLEVALVSCEHQPVVCHTGTDAWQILRSPDAPALAILDWEMPGLTGADVCRRVREIPNAVAPYLILVTARDGADTVVEGLEAGADDYIRKPFHQRELQARVRVGERMIGLQRALDTRVRELESALANIKQLHGLLPICAYCKMVRSDGNYWQQVEAYLTEHSQLSFSHSICPACYEHVVEPEFQQLQERKLKSGR